MASLINFTKPSPLSPPRQAIFIFDDFVILDFDFRKKKKR